MINSTNLNYLIYFLFIGIWSSIGSDPYNFLILFENKNYLYLNIAKINVKEIINFLRAIFPLCSLIICLFILIKYKLYNNQKSFIYILLLIQLIQIVATFISKNSIMSNFENIIDHIGRYHWIISSIASILLFMIAFKLKNFDMKKLFYISVFFLALMISIFSTKNTIDFYSMDIRTSLYNINVLREGAYFLDHQMPRVTGISRSIIFLYVIVFILNYDLKNNSKYLNYIFYIILSLLGSFLIIYQSKYALGAFIIVNIIFFYNFKNKFKGAKIILILFISQLLIFYIYSNSRIIINKIDSKFFTINEKEDLYKEENRIKHFRKFGNVGLEGMDYADHAIFSGRISLWKESIKYIKSRPFLGYGSMSDRAIINKQRLKDNYLVNPVSSAFFYAILSGGFFSLMLFLYFWLNIKKKIFNNFKIQDIASSENKIGSILILLIGLRCLIENSIMLFGVDYLLLLNSLYLTEKK
mgnify:CR=1 FL=1